MVSLSWCIRQGTRGEGDGDADYLPYTQYRRVTDRQTDRQTSCDSIVRGSALCIVASHGKNKKLSLSLTNCATLLRY